MKTHAEMDALRKFEELIRIKKIKKKTKIDLIVIRVNKNGNLSESAPCFHCTKELNESDISINKIYFSRSDGTITCVKFSDWVASGTSHVSKGWKWLSTLNCACK